MINQKDNKKKPLTLQEHQAVLLRMLIEFDKYCNNAGLRYYVAFGTCIGAVRHNGFIPWDDDVDIFMPRPDYEKLVKESTISEELEVVSLHNNHGHFHPFAYVNIVDTKTIMIEHNISKSTQKGAFLDVFPLDGIPDDKSTQNKHIKKLMRMESVLSIKINTIPGFRDVKSSVKSILHYLLFFINPVKLAIKIDKLSRKYGYDDYSNVIHGTLLSKTIHDYISPKIEFEDYTLFDFSGIKVRVPIGYDNILKREYGNYMKLPPKSQQAGHHGIKLYVIE